MLSCRMYMSALELVLLRSCLSVGSTLQIFAHIMEIDREVYWEYANVSCAGYPLQHIDTISESGQINTTSVMYKIVYGVSSPLKNCELLK